jgi:hypothetical protein
MKNNKTNSKKTTKKGFQFSFKKMMSYTKKQREEDLKDLPVFSSFRMSKIPQDKIFASMKWPEINCVNDDDDKWIKIAKTNEVETEKKLQKTINYLLLEELKNNRKKIKTSEK